MAFRIVNMTIPPDLLKAADATARAEGKTRSQLIRDAVERYIAERRSSGKDGSRVLSRLAALASKGSKLSAQDIDRLIYRRASTR